MTEASMSLSKYLQENKISISDFQKDKRSVKVKTASNNDVKNQLSLINEFHKSVSLYKYSSAHMIPTETGKLVEKYKKQKRNYKKYIELLKCMKDISGFEKSILDCSEEYLLRSEKVLKIINNSKYIKMIKRSMDKHEICLGNTNFSNLRKRENIEIVSLEYCSFCNVEMDAIYLLSKLKRRNVKLDYNDLIDTYVKSEGLDEHSKKFILAMLSYPSGVIEVVLNYKKGKKSSNCEDDIKKLKNEIIRDGHSLV